MDYLHLLFLSHVQRLSQSDPKNLQWDHEYVSGFLQYLEFVLSKKCICGSKCLTGAKHVSTLHFLDILSVVF